ncbi:hypothetical protein [Heyndrickxia sporothermodurans]|uniref:hypothetical protein n=1 Tax=Heyndrickxia sporothermodurans TaxID=46224 RepID=UPI0036966CDD
MNSYYLIHRELQSGERRFYKSREIFQYQNKYYVYGIRRTESEELAVSAIKNYWETVRKLHIQKATRIKSSGFFVG